MPAAPVLGSYLQEFYGWRACFVFMSGYSLVAFFSVFRGFQETSRHHHKDRLNFSYVVKTYGSLLKSPIFMGATLASFFSYGAFFSWFITAPVLLIHGLNVSPIVFGWITFFGAGTALSLASWINGKFVKRLGMPLMMRFGWGIMILSGFLMLAGPWSLWGIVIPALVFYFGSSFIWPNAFATAFTPFGQVAGYAGALYGFMQIGGAAALGGLMSYLPTETQTPLAITIIGASLFALLVYEFILGRKGIPG